MRKSILHTLLFILSGTTCAHALNDFTTHNPKLVLKVEESKLENTNDETRRKIEEAKQLIHSYYGDWQDKYGRLRRNLQIKLIPVQREIDVTGNRAEGVWSWTSFSNEEGSAVLGISGDLYVNINTTRISQEALIAHECSHAFLLTYQPKLLETKSDYLMYNEGLAELFAVKYEPNPWKNWSKLVLASRHQETFNIAELSGYGRRIFNVLINKPQTPHDIGFFYLYVIRNGQIQVDSDLKECTNNFIIKEIGEWQKKNPNAFDLRMMSEE
jgi:hypothetical protein